MADGSRLYTCSSKVNVMKIWHTSLSFYSSLLLQLLLLLLSCVSSIVIVAAMSVVILLLSVFLFEHCFQLWAWPLLWSVSIYHWLPHHDVALSHQALHNILPGPMYAMIIIICHALLSHYGECSFIVECSMSCKSVHSYAVLWLVALMLSILGDTYRTFINIQVTLHWYWILDRMIVPGAMK